MKPYLSFVLAGRNDNYGGNFLHRMQVFVTALLALRDKYNLSSELIIVEWNPPEERPRLKEAIRWPKNLDPGSVRIIQVSKNIHQQFPNSTRIPMFEYIAKNVGIRRAYGEFVLTTNQDILFNDDTIRFFASRKLQGGCFYRIDRCDIEGEVSAQAMIDEQLRFCQRHTKRVNTLGHTIDLNSQLPFHLALWLARREAAKRRKRARSQGQFRPEDDLHTNAAGDFMLMHKQDWHQIRGNVELPGAYHLDSYLCCIAASFGLRQVILGGKKCIFHQEHPYMRDPEQEAQQYHLWVKDCNEMPSKDHPLITNRMDWGLSNEELEEVAV